MTAIALESEYPVGITIEPDYENRNRLTTFFRLILAIPHLILVGGGTAGFSLGGASLLGFGDEWNASFGSGTGVLGLVAFVTAIVAWFAILFGSRHPRGIWDFCHLYLRWRVRALAYIALFRDEYPPFGDSEYPAAFHCDDPPEERDKLSVALRLIYAIPHGIVLWVLGIAWSVTSIIAWFAILFTGNYPRGLYDFGVGVLRWSVRVEAYVLLMRDEYPPFSLK